MKEIFVTLDDVNVSGKTILLRGDLNVPMEAGKVSDATRLERLSHTIKDLVSKKAKVVVLSHFGRPKGKVEPSMSLAPVVPALAKILGQPVAFCPESIGEKAISAVAALPPGGVLVLENTRFYEGEEKNDPAYAKALAQLGDIFVNDAFSVSHRAHASTEGLAHFLPACAGREMEGELKALQIALEHPQRPVMALVGGSKISTKLDLLKNLTARVDVLVLGGGMANTFLAAQGKPVGRSICEPDMLDIARAIMADSTQRGCQIVLPVDVVVGPSFAPHPGAPTVSVDAIPSDQMALDTGKESVAAIKKAMQAMKTVVWNGPLGAFEMKPFEQGTKAVAQEVARLTQAGQLVSVAGGGDTVSAVNMAGVGPQLTYVSTAGGAFLEWLEGRALPGVEILRKKNASTKIAVG